MLSNSLGIERHMSCVSYIEWKEIELRNRREKGGYQGMVE